MEGIKIKFKDIFKLFLIMIIAIGLLNVVYADSGPTIGENQAKITAQDYLNSHNLHYTAATHGDDSWQIKVKDTKTGEIKWIPFETYDGQFPTPNSEPTGNERYSDIYGVPTAWIVQINDNWKNVGQIYINDETGEILKVVINGKILENTMPQGNQTYEDKYASTNSNDTIDTTDQPQNTPDNTTWIILAVVSVLIIAGAGYWLKIRK